MSYPAPDKKKYLSYMHQIRRACLLHHCNVHYREFCFKNAKIKTKDKFYSNFAQKNYAAAFITSVKKILKNYQKSTLTIV